ncbi:MAG: ribonuclease III [Magnetovibrio sp.]|nr:ribonuclease III [Magnetovibrio sp.]
MIELEKHLGHVFKNTNQLHQALTHISTTKTNADSNERLEFLGDRVLGLIVANMLFESFKEEDEGDLAYRFAALVKRETLAHVAREIKLGDFIKLSVGERETGGAEKDSVLANTCEALIAALYLDGGFAAANNFIRYYWGPLLEKDPKPPKDPKTSLQEWAQAAGRSLPEYTVTNRRGPDHAPLFTVEVKVSGEIPTRGEGSNKQTAEQAAAKILLAQLVDVKK